MKKLALILALLLVVTGLSSCTPDATDSSDPPEPTGIPQTPNPEEKDLQSQEALKIGDVSISVTEFDFYFNDAYHSMVELYEGIGFLDYMGLDFSLPFSEQEYDEGITWEDYFKETAIENLTQVVLQSREAEKEGITLTDEDIQNLDHEFESIQLYAEEEGIGIDALLQSIYGSSMTVQGLRMILERSYLSERYRNTIMDGFSIGMDEITEYYEQNQGDFSYVDYHNFIFDSELYEEDLGRTPTEQEQADFKESQWKLAQKLYDKVTDAAGFREASAEFMDEDTDVSDLFDQEGEDEDITYQEGIYISELEAQQAEFLSDPARKEGDKILLEGDGYFEVILFISRYVPTTEDWQEEVSELLLEEMYQSHLDTVRDPYTVTENQEGMALAMAPLPV